MAELLVHGHVPWTAILEIGAMTDARVGQASAVLTSVGVDAPPIRTRSGWYF